CGGISAVSEGNDGISGELVTIGTTQGRSANELLVATRGQPQEIDQRRRVPGLARLEFGLAGTRLGALVVGANGLALVTTKNPSADAFAQRSGDVPSMFDRE